MKRWGWIVALLTFGALGLRLWNLSAVGLSGWDEGVYALSARWLLSGGREGVLASPSHGPPLYTLLLALTFLIFGQTDTVALALSAVAGAAVVPVLYLLGRDWFGRREGVIAAALGAVLPLGVVFSRHALTDIFFTLFFLWALHWLSTRRIERWRQLWFLLPLALATATKYHGAGVLLVGGLVFGLGRIWPAEKKDETGSCLIPDKRTLLAGVAVLALGLLLWFVLLLWKWGLLRLADNYGAYVGSVNSPLFVLQVLVWGCGAPLLGFALAGLVFSLGRRCRGDLWLVAGVAFFLAIGLLYRPYPRLFLPLGALLGLAAARGIVFLGGRCRFSLAFMAVVGVGLSLFNLGLSIPWVRQSSSGYRDCGRALSEEKSWEPLLVCAQEPLLFYLDRPAVFLADPAFGEALAREEPFYLVSDHWLERRGAARTFFEERRGHFEKIKEWDNPLPAEVVLNSRDFEALWKLRRDRAGYHIGPLTLWRYQPPLPEPADDTNPKAPGYP